MSIIKALREESEVIKFDNLFTRDLEDEQQFDLVFAAEQDDEDLKTIAANKIMRENGEEKVFDLPDCVYVNEDGEVKDKDDEVEDISSNDADSDGIDDDIEAASANPTAAVPSVVVNVDADDVNINAGDGGTSFEGNDEEVKEDASVTVNAKVVNMTTNVDPANNEGEVAPATEPATPPVPAEGPSDDEPIEPIGDVEVSVDTEEVPEEPESSEADVEECGDNCGSTPGTDDNGVPMGEGVEQIMTSSQLEDILNTGLGVAPAYEGGQFINVPEDKSTEVVFSNSNDKEVREAALQEATYSFFPKFQKSDELKKYEKIAKEADEILNDHGEVSKTDVNKIFSLVLRIIDIIENIYSILTTFSCIAIVTIPAHLIGRGIIYAINYGEEALAKNTCQKAYDALINCANKEKDKKKKDLLLKEAAKIKKQMVEVEKKAKNEAAEPTIDPPIDMIKEEDIEICCDPTEGEPPCSDCDAKAQAVPGPKVDSSDYNPYGKDPIEDKEDGMETIEDLDLDLDTIGVAEAESMDPKEDYVEADAETSLEGIGPGITSGDLEKMYVEKDVDPNRKNTAGIEEAAEPTIDPPIDFIKEEDESNDSEGPGNGERESDTEVTTGSDADDSDPAHEAAEPTIDPPIDMIKEEIEAVKNDDNLKTSKKIEGEFEDDLAPITDDDIEKEFNSLPEDETKKDEGIDPVKPSDVPMNDGSAHEAAEPTKDDNASALQEASFSFFPKFQKSDELKKYESLAKQADEILNDNGEVSKSDVNKIFGLALRIIDIIDNIYSVLTTFSCIAIVTIPAHLIGRGIIYAINLGEEALAKNACEKAYAGLVKCANEQKDKKKKETLLKEAAKIKEGMKKIESKNEAAEPTIDHPIDFITEEEIEAVKNDDNLETSKKIEGEFEDDLAPVTDGDVEKEFNSLPEDETKKDEGISPVKPSDVPMNDGSAHEAAEPTVDNIEFIKEEDTDILDSDDIDMDNNCDISPIGPTKVIPDEVNAPKGDMNYDKDEALMKEDFMDQVNALDNGDSFADTMNTGLNISPEEITPGSDEELIDDEVIAFIEGE